MITPQGGLLHICIFIALITRPGRRGCAAQEAAHGGSLEADDPAAAATGVPAEAASPPCSECEVLFERLQVRGLGFSEALSPELEL